VRRREFITLVGGAAATWPLAASAQQADKVWRIGMLEPTAMSLNATNFNALRGGLRQHGYIEGQDFVIEYRSADGRSERFPDLASELVSLKVDVIVTRGTPAAMAAKNASQIIPVVMAASGEPVGTGLVAGLARPGGNVTGLSAVVSEVEPKRVELLRDMLPRFKRLAALYNMSNPVGPPRWETLKPAARSLGIEPQLLDVRKLEDLERAFEKAVARRADALVVANDTVTSANRRQVAELAAKHRLPAMFASREFVEVGGLAAYAVSYPDLYRRAATFIDKIFKGAKPTDLPVEQPTKFELIVNLKTAKTIGIELPTAILLRADEVIE
jgi:putative ABC transport system substrate-binding protein